MGVFGGSGFYSFLDDVSEVEMDTPFGEPSAPVTIGTVGGLRVAFMPRHGVKHQFPPHTLNYRANAWAFKQLGVERILGPCAVGSLQSQVEPGQFVFCDQLVDRTNGRPSTFYDGPVTTHISFADPYCPTMREFAIQEARGQDLAFHDRGTMVVIQGPRFSTRAESADYAQRGWEVIGMTQHPEVPLARELEMCYLNISLVTDYDVGVAGEVAPVTHEEVMRVFQENISRLRELLFRVIPALPEARDCSCATALRNARLEA
ncbi:MAG: S-methyl-5'-thioadenosine phosphorylase [Actinobacteria bacterium]|nr:MAG: S-methyl-5'-thioadenosine phosphorylase [Actinomycetota bacterium]